LHLRLQEVSYSACFAYATVVRACYSDILQFEWIAISWYSAGLEHQAEMLELYDPALKRKTHSLTEQFKLTKGPNRSNQSHSLLNISIQCILKVVIYLFIELIEVK
jgi:hypothetical protein